MKTHSAAPNVSPTTCTPIADIEMEDVPLIQTMPRRRQAIRSPSSPHKLGKDGPE